MVKQLKNLSIEDQCMVHRFLYYVKSDPIISDYEYDMLERKAIETAPEDHPIHLPGSSLAKSYDQKIIDVANALH
jgi:NAD-dependent DNA ligase